MFANRRYPGSWIGNTAVRYAKARKRRIRTILYVGLTLGWLLLVTAGSWKLLVYSLTAAQPESIAKQWPRLSRVERSGSTPTVVLALHPHCPCSNATLEELAIIAAHSRGQLYGQVLLYRPRNSAPSWSDTGLRSAAVRIPGVHVFDDPGGVEATGFQARISGEVSVYDVSGRLLFHGGITPYRGHAGDSYGRDTVISLLLHDRTTGFASSPIFGCSLREESSLTGRGSL